MVIHNILFNNKLYLSGSETAINPGYMDGAVVASLYCRTILIYSFMEITNFISKLNKQPEQYHLQRR
jgi:hypothetical protein